MVTGLCLIWLRGISHLEHQSLILVRFYCNLKASVGCVTIEYKTQSSANSLLSEVVAVGRSFACIRNREVKDLPPVLDGTSVHVNWNLLAIVCCTCSLRKFSIQETMGVNFKRGEFGKQVLMSNPMNLLSAFLFNINVSFYVYICIHIRGQARKMGWRKYIEMY